MTIAKRQGPLVGMRVLDMAHVMAGPTCARMLADMGADVVKIEKADGGDDTRRMLPPSIKGEPAAYMMMNRNKRGIVLDLKKPAGREALKRLVKTADVLIENYRYDTLDKLGIGYEELKKINPGLIYCAVSGFGRTGPWSTQGGYDLIAQGMSGLMAITGEGPGRPPVKVGSPACDITAGIIAAMGVCAAYAHKQKTGEGQVVDTSLFEAGITLTYWQSAICMATGVSPGPMGSGHPLNTPYQAFETKDGWMNVGASNTKMYPMLCDILGCPQLATDPRFKVGLDRMKNLDVFIEEISPYFRKKTTAEWLTELEKVGIPSGPVLSVKEMLSHPQTLARDMVATVEHPVAGPVETIGFPVKFSKTPGAIRTAAPLFGQHTREVLSEAGFTAAEIDALFAEEAAVEPARKAAAE